MHNELFPEEAAGTDIVRKTIATITPSSMETMVVIDLVAYDCFPAWACLEARSKDIGELALLDLTCS